MASASDYKYIIPSSVLIVIATVLLRRNLKKTVLLILACLLIFLVFNPMLWSDTFGKIATIWNFYHNMAAAYFKSGNYPWFYQCKWLLYSVPWQEKLFPIKIDFYILITAMLGYSRLKKRDFMLGAWFLAAGLFLLVFPVRLPQYLVVFMPVIS